MKTSKPDLMGAKPRAVQDKRILAQLEHGPRTATAVVRAGWTIDGWTVGLCVLLLLMCSVAWLMHDQRITPESFRHRDGGRSKAATASVARRADSAPAGEPAATIVNEAAPQTDARTDTPAATHMAATAPPTPTAITVAIANAAATQAPTRATPHKPATTPTRTAASATPPTHPANDTDVTLLTALVAHAGQPTAVAPERSRDIVERQNGDTTVQLLARCKQLGLIEGMLCRSRICSGRWEADAACRAPAH